MRNINNIHQDPKVNISVKNFGPISEANIDLRPLTVFIGPSNTGKTYFSTQIYALHSIFNGFSELGFLSPFGPTGFMGLIVGNEPERGIFLDSTITAEEHQELLEKFMRYENQIFGKIRSQINEDNLINSCSGDRCTVDMQNIPPNRVIIHVEQEFNSRKKSEKRCDRLLFFINTEQKLVAVPIELKSGKAEESDVVQQLENSLKFAERIAIETSTSQTEYCPVPRARH